jgi:hypothetical protein
MNCINYVITPKNITVVFDSGATEIFSLSSEQGEKLLGIIAKNDNVIEKINEFFTEEEQKRLSQNGFSTDGEKISYKGEDLNEQVKTFLTKLLKENKNIKGIKKFCEKCLQNPQKDSIEQMWNFIRANGLFISNSGNFVGYKAVLENRFDKYSQKYKNSNGAVIKEDRNTVENDPEKACGKGLHVGTWRYAKEVYGSHDDVIILISVNPKNVVSVPKDHSFQKMRICEYKVLKEVKAELTETAASRIEVTTGKKDNKIYLNLVDGRINIPVELVKKHFKPLDSVFVRKVNGTSAALLNSKALPLSFVVENKFQTVSENDYRLRVYPPASWVNSGKQFYAEEKSGIIYVGIN